MSSLLTSPDETDARAVSADHATEGKADAIDNKVKEEDESKSKAGLDTIVRLCVGGTFFMTTRRTLCNVPNTFANMFGEHFASPNPMTAEDFLGAAQTLGERAGDKSSSTRGSTDHPCFFIDRNPRLFGLLLDYMRTLDETTTILMASGVPSPSCIARLQALRHEATYFGVAKLQAEIEKKGGQCEICGLLGLDMIGGQNKSCLHPAAKRSHLLAGSIVNYLKKTGIGTRATYNTLQGKLISCEKLLGKHIWTVKKMGEQSTSAGSAELAELAEWAEMPELAEQKEIKTDRVREQDLGRPLTCGFAKCTTDKPTCPAKHKLGKTRRCNKRTDIGLDCKSSGGPNIAKTRQQLHNRITTQQGIQAQDEIKSQKASPQPRGQVSQERAVSEFHPERQRPVPSYMTSMQRTESERESDP